MTLQPIADTKAISDKYYQFQLSRPGLQCRILFDRPVSPREAYNLLEDWLALDPVQETNAVHPNSEQHGLNANLAHKTMSTLDKLFNSTYTTVDAAPSDRAAVEHLAASLNSIADSLDAALIAMLGEDAAWELNAGSTNPPTEKFGKGHPAFIGQVWAAREEANSSIAWVQEQQSEGYASYGRV